MASFHSLLLNFDPPLYEHVVEKLQVKPQVFRFFPFFKNSWFFKFYAFRWLSLLLSQEFPLPDVISLWDSLFSDPQRCILFCLVGYSLLFYTNLQIFPSALHLFGDAGEETRRIAAGWICWCHSTSSSIVLIWLFFDDKFISSPWTPFLFPYTIPTPQSSVDYTGSHEKFSELPWNRRPTVGIIGSGN